MRKNNKALYESIMRKVAKVVKSALNESVDVDITTAPYFVAATDKFMSKWGKSSGNSKIVVACWTIEQQYECEKAMSYDKGLTRVTTYNKLPNFRNANVEYMDFEDSLRWNKSYMSYYGQKGESDGYQVGMKNKF